MREILIDPARSSVRLVVNPERMVIAEARRTYTYLSLFGYRVDAVVANRLLPAEVSDPWFDRWKELHVEHLKTIEDSFAPLPVLTVELAAEELVGVDALRAFGARVYGERDAASILHEGQPLKITRRAGRTTLVLELPVRRPRRPRAGPPRRRAARPGRARTGGPSPCRTRCGTGRSTTPA